MIQKSKNKKRNSHETQYSRACRQEHVMYFVSWTHVHIHLYKQKQKQMQMYITLLSTTPIKIWHKNSGWNLKGNTLQQGESSHISGEKLQERGGDLSLETQQEDEE